MNIVVFLGGRSAEHDISVITGCQAIAAASVKHIVFPVYIDGDGTWFYGKRLTEIGRFRDMKKKGMTRVALRPGDAGLFSIKGKRVLKKIDCAVIALHGRNGEDGTVQGALELSGVPYTSPGVAASALAMDKVLSKTFLKGLGLPVLPSIDVKKTEVSGDIIGKLKAAGLGYPVIVKPACLGSSIGVKKAANEEELRDALETAFEFDDLVLIERFVADMTEYNCSVLGSGDNIETSVIEQPAKTDGILTFGDKYLGGGKGTAEKGTGKTGGTFFIDGGKTAGARDGTEQRKGKTGFGPEDPAGMAGLERRLDPDIPDGLKEKIRETSKAVFSALHMSGVIRIDYIFENSSRELFVNEINTVPGSLAFYLWQASGIPFPELIDRLIETALSGKALRDGMKYSFLSPVLNSVPGMSAKAP